jgi:hypothetical protein
MSRFLSRDERRRHGEQFLCTLYALSDGDVTQEYSAEEIYTKISHSVGVSGKKDEKTDKGLSEKEVIINDLIYHLTQERLDRDGQKEPPIEVNKTRPEQFVKLSHAGLEHCIEECWLTLANLNIRQPYKTKWKPRPIPSAD